MAANSNSRTVDLDKVRKFDIYSLEMILQKHQSETNEQFCVHFQFQQIWTTLKEGITQIYKREPSLTMAQYMDLYTYVSH